MRAFAVYPSWAGPSSCPYQSSMCAFRRSTAAPLRLYKLQTPHTGVTHQSSAPTQTPEDVDAVEAAMRAAKPGNGTSTGTRQNSDVNKTPAQLALVEAEALKKEFLKVKEEVSRYKELCEVNQKQKDKIDRLQQDKEELENKLAALVGEAEALRKDFLQAKEEVSKYVGLEEEKAALKSQFAMQQDDQQRLVELARAEAVEPLQLQLEELSNQVAQREEQLVHLVGQHQAEVQQAVERALQQAAEEAAGPMQQQLEELSMQLQNSQAQLERLGEAVEAAEAEKLMAVEALQEENRQLLVALEGSTRRLAELVYPPGSLPVGMTISTRLEGNVDILALAAHQDVKVAKDEVSQASSPDGEDVRSSRTQLKPADSASVEKSGTPGHSGFLGWLFGVFRLWLYQVLGGLLLYYAASILRGMPPDLNAAFGVGCVIVCTLMSWTSHLLFPRWST
ncbi:hypothetical protein Vretimale_2080 [Volvox reticuliferus]|uniref:Uncharacterized protein n=1 Tax=Volvox reticuliferus TaxID=1737510 RepID=A0A8J4G2L7_9CHLO|nr:hypothetical protein Vretifemale_4278 [Volvox reticuliferus]GIL96207.1 hypothetical protein Vretimale_2080 [Volvox reticuliferus]